MTNKEKFEGFKQKIIDDNETNMVKKLERNMGMKQVDKSNKKLKNMTEEAACRN